MKIPFPSAHGSQAHSSKTPTVYMTYIEQWVTISLALTVGKPNTNAYRMGVSISHHLTKMPKADSIASKILIDNSIYTSQYG